MAISPNERNLDAKTIADKLEKIIDKAIKSTQNETIFITTSILNGIKDVRVFEDLRQRYLDARWKYFSITSDRDGRALVLSELEKPFGDSLGSYPENH